MTTGTQETPEQLWTRAHEHVRRGDFANAVRDLAACFAMLQAKNDPRVHEVHKRWTEVHRMYVEDGQRQTPPVVEKAPSVEAEAEAAANAGDLDKALELYKQAATQSPQNQLIRERLAELTEAKRRATDLAKGKAEDDWSDINEPATTAPTMAVDDAPVGMQSLDVAFSVGEPIDAAKAEELPVDGADAQVALLEDLLARVAANRRRAS